MMQEPGNVMDHHSMLSQKHGRDAYYDVVYLGADAQ
jgi:hypothetical protein